MPERLSCPVCERVSAHFGTGLVLGTYEAEYRRCLRCGAVFAADPHWLAESYEESIAESDIGLVARNLRTSRVTIRVLRVLFRHARSFLDFGAGNGMFVRMMRDAGYAFRYYDPYGPNIFAKGLESRLDDESHFDVGTAFEVLEHLCRPVDELGPLVGSCDAIMATTLVLPEPPPRLDAWWYYALESGQHVILYTERSLDELASRLGLVRSSAADFHVFSRKRIPTLVLRPLVDGRMSFAITRLCRRESLLGSDYERITGRPLR